MSPTGKQDSPQAFSRLARAELLSEFHEHLKQSDLALPSIRLFVIAAKHLLVWSVLEQVALATFDDGVIRRFRNHDCRCPLTLEGLGRCKRLTVQLRRTMHGVESFFRFLDATGRTTHPGEQALGRSLLHEFLADCKGLGFSASVRRKLASHTNHFLLWLHRTRVSISLVTPGVVNDFLNHDCICPRYFIRPREPQKRTIYALLIRKFVSFLVERGITDKAHFTQADPPKRELDDFSGWLKNYRGASESTVEKYCHLLSPILAIMGTDAALYDAALVRQTLLQHFSTVSSATAGNAVTAMRMYMRFLSTSGECDPGLMGAIPSPANWKLSQLPRYLPMDKIERTIGSCAPGTKSGVRDKAVLLLLARLGVRAGDITGLRLSDIDWENGRFLVSGKSPALHLVAAPARCRRCAVGLHHDRAPNGADRQSIPARPSTAPSSQQLPSRIRHCHKRHETSRSDKPRAWRRLSLPPFGRDPPASLGRFPGFCRHPTSPSIRGYNDDLRQGGCPDAARSGATMDWRHAMNLTRHASRYISLKRHLGYKFIEGERLLLPFVAFAQQHQDEFLRNERILQWAGSAPSTASAQRTLTLLRNFAMWLHAEDPRHEIPDRHALGRTRRKRPRPYLLMPEQIRLVMDAALNLPPADSITPYTVRTMIGLAATTGLRRSEVVGLTLSDVTNDGLIVRDSKFGKSRLVAIHDSVHAALNQYISVRSQACAASDHLFILATGKPPTAQYISQKFLKLLRIVGLRGGPGEPGPRFHSLRHSFAVRSLESAEESHPTDISRHMLALTTYLGHVSVANTYWYLEANATSDAINCECG